MEVRFPPRIPSAFESAELGRAGYFHSSQVAVTWRVKVFPIRDGRPPGQPGRSRAQSHPGSRQCPRASALAAAPGVSEIFPCGSKSFIIFTIYVIHIYENCFFVKRKGPYFFSI